MPNPILGIDFGTSSCAVAILGADGPRLIPDRAGREFLPSMVVVRDDGELLVGHEAVRESHKLAGQCFAVSSIKRRLDRTIEIKPGDGRTSPLILSALILAELRLQAESHFSCDFNDAVIAVPANFGYFQRQFIKEAALIAGLNPIRIVNEATTSVCMLPKDFEGLVTTADLGGGTFDVSVVETGDGVSEVIYTDGADDLGGDDFTEVLEKLLLRKADMDFDVNYCRTHPVTSRRIRSAAEELKCLLSGSDAAEARIPYLRTHAGSFRDFACTLSRMEFEQECAALLRRIESLVEDTRPYVEKRGRMKKNWDSKLERPNAPAKASEGWFRQLFSRVAAPTEPSGAATLKPSSPIPPFYSSIWLLGNATRMPAIGHRLRKQWHVQPAKVGDLKSPVALGAAQIAGMLSGAEKSILLLDVTPRSVGTADKAGDFVPMILRNTSLPVACTQSFTTTVPNQTSILLPIMEESRRAASGAVQIGTLRIEGLIPCAAGIPKIDVKFDVDANAVLRVSAQDTATGRSVAVQCDELQLPERTLNQYHGMVQDWLAQRRRRYGASG